MQDAIQEVKSGNKEAYRAIVAEYGPRVRAFLASALSDPNTVDDLFQITFIAAYQNLDRYNPEREFGGWLHGIARNQLNAHLRKHYRRNRVIVGMRDEIMATVGAEVDAFQHDRTDRLRNLRTCIDKLPDRTQAFVRGKHLEGATVADLAEQFGTSVTNVTTNLHRARKALRLCMETQRT